MVSAVSLNIRKARKPDLGACAGILVKEFSKQGEKWTLCRAKGRLSEYLFLARHNRAANFCLVESGKVVGFIFCEFITYWQGKTLWIGEFAVASECQGKGYGLQALRHIEHFAKKNGFAAMILATNKKEKAFKIYKKFGFKPTTYFFMAKEF